MSDDLIFISYSRVDSEFALDLAKRLREAGFSIWLDQLDIKPSMHWDNTIEKALESCGTMLVLLSDSSVQSENVKDEYSYAIEQGKNVLPVLLENCEIPFRLKRLQYSDFSNDTERGMRSLLASLKVDQSKSSISLKAPGRPITANQKAIKKAKKKSKTAYILLLLVVIVSAVVVSFWDSIFPNQDPGNFSVLVKGATAIEKDQLPENAMVSITVDGQELNAQVNSNGEAIFTDIPATWFGTGSLAEISYQDPNKEPYQALKSDSSYQLTRDGSITLTVKLFGLDNIAGIVKDFVTGDPIEGVRITVNGEESLSAASGEFQLEIPAAKQKKFQTIRAYKEGYQMYELTSVPIQTDMELPILLKPKSN